MLEFELFIAGRKYLNDQIWRTDTATVIQFWRIADDAEVGLYDVVDLVISL